jgi:hypothetical protein
MHHCLGNWRSGRHSFQDCENDDAAIRPTNHRDSAAIHTGLLPYPSRCVRDVLSGSRRGRPKPSQTAWSLDFRPPLVCPRQRGQAPFAADWQRCDGPSGYPSRRRPRIKRACEWLTCGPTFWRVCGRLSARASGCTSAGSKLLPIHCNLSSCCVFLAYLGHAAKTELMKMALNPRNDMSAFRQRSSYH